MLKKTLEIDNGFIFTENLLNNLLSIEATRSADYPTIEDLISDPFFANAMITSTDPLSNHVNRKQYLKLSSNVKEAVLRHRQAYEQRLQEDFKQVGKICTSKNYVKL